MRNYNTWRSTWLGRATGRAFKALSPYLPAVLVSKINYLLSEWVYVPEGWHPQHAAMKDWNDPEVANAVEQNWPMLVKNVEGPGPLGVSHFPWSVGRENAGYHNAMMSYGYVLALASRKKDSISVLDWGGGAGHYNLYSKALLPEVQIEYHCYDVRSLCEAGNRLQPEAHFHHGVMDVAERYYDLVISSSSLHYVEDWREVLRRLAAATKEFLYVARLQMVSRSPSFVVEQRPHRPGYQTQCLSWFLNRDEFLSCAQESGLELVREFIYLEQWAVRGAPEKQEGRGFLFRRRPASDSGA